MKTVVVFSDFEFDDAGLFIRHSCWNEFCEKKILVFSRNSGDRLVFLEDKQYQEGDKLPDGLNVGEKIDLYFIFHTPKNMDSQESFISPLGDIVGKKAKYSHQAINKIYQQIALVMNADDFGSELNKLCEMISFPAFYDLASRVLIKLLSCSLAGQISTDEWELLLDFVGEYESMASTKLPNYEEDNAFVALFPEDPPDGLFPKQLLSEATDVLQANLLDLKRLEMSVS